MIIINMVPYLPNQNKIEILKFLKNSKINHKDQKLIYIF